MFKLAKIPLFGEAANIIYKLVRGFVGGHLFPWACPNQTPGAAVPRRIPRRPDRQVNKNRLALGGALDGIIAAGRINAEEKGEGSCAENSECRDLEGKMDVTEDAPRPAAKPVAAGARGSGRGFFTNLSPPQR